MSQNYLGLRGLEFVEFGPASPEHLHQLFISFGFSKIMKHESKDVDYYKQNDIHFLLNKQPGSFADKFAQEHGPSISSMGWRVVDAKAAQQEAVKKGAKAAEGDYPFPAIYGIGENLIYFIENFQDKDRYSKWGFKAHPNPQITPSKGFICIDHLTNNVYPGQMKKWTKFYKEIFGFTQIRYFDIRGAQTGLTSFALKSPCGTFCIPINEGTEKKSQINEYLEEYKGEGIQHLAFTTHDILRSLEELKKTNIKTLDIDDEYYQEVFDRVPNVTEEHQALQKMQVLVDGDERGYLLQIFTKNIIGPIFVEIIQRKNNFSFGEGNFGALFRSIERDQQQRGYL